MNELELFKRDVTEMANAHTDAMRDMNEREAMGYVRNILADNELVVAVWQDEAEDNGIGMLVIKGHNVLRESMASGIAVQVKTSAVPCFCGEHPPRRSPRGSSRAGPQNAQMMETIK